LFCSDEIFFYICTPLRRKRISEKDKEERFERLKRSKKLSLFAFTGKCKQELTRNGKRALRRAKNKKKKRKINS